MAVPVFFETCGSDRLDFKVGKYLWNFYDHRDILYSRIKRSELTMTLLSSILLGLIQGIAEFLPISSSGHLAIAENLLNMSGASEVPEFFDVLLHLGTLLAVFVA